MIYYSAYKAAILLGMNTGTLISHIKLGRVAGAFFNEELNKYRVPKSYVDKVIADQTKETP